MTVKEKIQIARIAIDKGYDYETLEYSNYMYGKESFTDEVFDYVIEAREQGTTWFYNEYAEYLK